MLLRLKKECNGSDYGSFSLQVDSLDDKGLTKDNILEQYDNLNFNHDYDVEKFGEYVTIDSDGKLTFNGDWIIVPSLFMITTEIAGSKSISSNGTRVIIHRGTTTILVVQSSVKHQWS